MSNPERDYFAIESDTEHRAEIAKADREHPSDPYGWEANRVQSRWERQQFDRGCGLLLPIIGLAFVVLAAWGSFDGWLNGWQVAAFWVLSAFALVCVTCCASDGTRARLDTEAPRSEQS